MLNMYGQYDTRTLSGIDWCRKKKSKRNKQPAEFDETSIHIAIMTDGFLHVKCFTLDEVESLKQQGYYPSEFS